MRFEVVYLDRDGTINVDRRYLSDPDEFVFCAGAVRGMQRMVTLGLDLVVITNQSGVSRGYFDLDRLNSIHEKMLHLLAKEGVYLAGVYSCPHSPDDKCCCRKPLPGLIHQAETDLGRRRGVMIGDAVRDVQAGQAAGLYTVGLMDAQTAFTMERPPDYLATDLEAAATWIEEHMELGS